MLRVGLTGGLGSGKSTAAAMFRAHGAHVVSADELGRQSMQPGEPVFAAIVAHFGPEVLTPEGVLDRAVLARISFVEGRVAELNAIVHPPVIARQSALAEELRRREPEAVLMVESALLFETEHAGAEGWRSRFDRVVLVTAPDAVKVERYVARTADTAQGSTPEGRAADAWRRLTQQIGDAQKAEWADFVLENGGSMERLQTQVDALWPRLVAEARKAEPSPAATD